MTGDSTVVWFRRDLRLHDHPALSEAGSGPIAPLFVLDPGILDGRSRSPNRIWFLLGALDSLAIELAGRGARLSIAVGRPSDVVPSFARAIGASVVTVSRDLTPYGRSRDKAVSDLLAADGIAFRPKPGLLVHEPEEVLTDAGRPYAVFTPFHRRWAARPLRAVLPAPDRLLSVDPRSEIDAPVSHDGVRALPAVARLAIPGPTADPALLPGPGESAARERLARWLATSPAGGPTAYAERRDRLADEGGTSRLGPDLRFGLLSPVEVATRALARDGGADGSRRFMSELAWRDFYAHVLWHDPGSARDGVQRRFAGADWPGSAADAEAWRAGRTGFPIVDAAMRQLVASGFMPNRARMIVASFLTKDLLVDWRVGEAHFMRHLFDGDPASNSGGWQWAASVGTDAQPYFRVFNPVTQGRRFDPDGAYVRRWVPELAHVPTTKVHEPWTMSGEEQAAAGCRIGADYPSPMVDHARARERAIAWFGDSER